MLLFFLLPITPRLTDVTDLCFWRLMLTFLIDLCGSPGLPILNLQEVVNILGIFLTSLIFSAYILFVFVWCWLLTAKANSNVSAQFAFAFFFFVVICSFWGEKVNFTFKNKSSKCDFWHFYTFPFFFIEFSFKFSKFFCICKNKNETTLCRHKLNHFI